MGSSVISRTQSARGLSRTIYGDALSIVNQMENTAIIDKETKDNENIEEEYDA